MKKFSIPSQCLDKPYEKKQTDQYMQDSEIINLFTNMENQALERKQYQQQQQQYQNQQQQQFQQSQFNNTYRNSIKNEAFEKFNQTLDRIQNRKSLRETQAISEKENSLNFSHHKNKNYGKKNQQNQFLSSNPKEKKEQIIKDKGYTIMDGKIQMVLEPEQAEMALDILDKIQGYLQERKEAKKEELDNKKKKIQAMQMTYMKDEEFQKRRQVVRMDPYEAVLVKRFMSNVNHLTQSKYVLNPYIDDNIPWGTKKKPKFAKAPQKATENDREELIRKLKKYKKIKQIKQEQEKAQPKLRKKDFDLVEFQSPNPGTVQKFCNQNFAEKTFFYEQKKRNPPAESSDKFQAEIIYLQTYFELMHPGDYLLTCDFYKKGVKKQEDKEMENNSDQEDGYESDPEPANNQLVKDSQKIDEYPIKVTVPEVYQGADYFAKLYAENKKKREQEEKEREEKYLQQFKTKFTPKPIPPQVSDRELWQKMQFQQENRRTQIKQESVALTLANEKPFSFYNKDPNPLKRRKQENFEKQEQFIQDIMKTKFKANKIAWTSAADYYQRLKEQEIQKREERKASRAIIMQRTMGNQQNFMKENEKKLEEMSKQFSFKPKPAKEIPDFEFLHENFQNKLDSKKLSRPNCQPQPFNFTETRKVQKREYLDLENQLMKKTKEKPEDKIQKARESTRNQPQILPQSTLKQESLLQQKWKERESNLEKQILKDLLLQKKEKKKEKLVNEMQQILAEKLKEEKLIQQQRNDELKQKTLQFSKQTLQNTKEQEEKIQSRPLIINTQPSKGIIYPYNKIYNNYKLVLKDVNHKKKMQNISEWNQYYSQEELQFKAIDFVKSLNLKQTTQSTGVTKKINKKEQTKSDRKNQLDQIKQNKQEAKYIQTEKDIVNNQFFETGTKEKLFNTLKNIKPPRIIALVPFNEKANAFNIKNGLEQYITNLMAQNEEINMDQQNNTNQNTLSFKFPYFQFFANPKTMQGLVQENFLFAACDRNLQSTLDILKVADIVCPILSCADCKLEETNLDPYGKAGAFDDYAYRVMSCLRLQGMPPTINILQDSQMFQGDKKNKVKKLFQRFFAGEFSNEMVTLEDEATILPYLRKLQTTPLQSLTWREDRGYMLADKVSFNQNTQLLEVEGFLKGNYLNANQLMHVTGYDDYQIEKIEILKNPYKLRLKSKKSSQNLLKQQIQKEQHKSFINGGEQSMLEESTIQSQKIQGLDLDKDIILTQHSDPSLQEPLQRIVKKDQNHFVIKDGNILNAIDDDENKNNQEHDLIEENQTNNMQEQQQQNPQNVIDQMIKQEKEQRKQKQKQNQIQQGNDEIEMDDEQMQNESDISYDEADDLEQDDMEIQQEKENRKQVQIQDRTEEDLYEDEVEYNGQVALRERYGAYKYLKSFKTSEWDPLDNLPDPYELIYTFKHYQKTKRLALEYAQEQAFAYAGFYVKIYLKNFPVSLLQNHNPNTPFILSGLLRHERKMTQVHLKDLEDLQPLLYIPNYMLKCSLWISW
ncbi:hypothetical protein PPERSA_10766 [Pseudocohnilembus persalinus]|uniref:Uncharacterized protein n=1 Tax=Pseudocohnilembus persalinus TaxID=266149 RepID=A0A0V0QDK9_PSEPJ|nr:hypothetical protein PPERSA_10766 [Pseudocohnilembus persalinus]|eukprot:KRX00267.1 hypothetical protein PPERSA_10766 [Pseudocohnilembus persalinus]